MSHRGIAGGLLLVLAVLIGPGCGPGQPAQEQAKRPPPPVVVKEVQPENVVISRTYLVTLAPGEQANVVSRASGYLLAWLVDRGDRVRAGQKMALIEGQELSDQEHQAAAQLEAARAALANARDQAERARRLLQQKFISQAEADAAEAQARVAEAQVRAAEAALGLTRTRKAYAEIAAPFDGYVVRRHVDIGALVGPQGPALFTVGSLARIRAVAAVPQDDVKFLKVGQVARLAVEGMDGTWEGRVSRMSPSLDTATRTLEIEVQFDNPEERLRPGMFGRLTLELERLERALVVPPRAIARDGETGTAFVVRDGRAREVRLRLGRTLPDGRVQVLDGLNPGDRLITLGRDLVHDGMEVQAVPEPREDASSTRDRRLPPERERPC